MLDEDGGRLEDEWMGEEEVCTAAVIKKEMGGNAEVDVVAVAVETGSVVVVVADETSGDVMVGAASQEETGIDVKVNVDAVEETGRGMKESKS